MKLIEVQDILYDILCIVDDICKENHIAYTLAGGTLLGAVRHSGFIPWDDDIDICVWRKDYPRICEALDRELPSHLKLIKPEDFHPYFYDFVTRVADQRYFWHKPTEEDIAYDNKQNHIGIDIFILDHMGDSILWEIKKNAFLQKVFYGLAMGHRYCLKKDNYTILQKLQTGCLNRIGAKMKIANIFEWRNVFCMKYYGKPTKYCLTLNDLLNYIGIPIESAWYDEIIQLPFRDRSFPAPKEYDKKLTATYGDYMKPDKNWDKYIQHFSGES